jgi:prepilin-type N-terminal cleavage/methylation domain-containing protein
MEAQNHPDGRSCGLGGYTLPELMVVVAIICVCLVAGAVSLPRGLAAQESRGAAQSWQAAAAWAQVGVLWHGGAVELLSTSGELSLSHDFALCGGDLGRSAPAVPVTTNLARWRDGAGVAVKFGGTLGSPDGGGSLFFVAPEGGYRVVVRPESGLTARTRAEASP